MATTAAPTRQARVRFLPFLPFRPLLLPLRRLQRGHQVCAGSRWRLCEVVSLTATGSIPVAHPILPARSAGVAGTRIATRPLGRQ